MQPSGRWDRKKRPGRYFVGDFGAGHYTHVYAVAPIEGGNIKFGMALDVQSRFSGIQVGSPVKLAMLGSVFVPWEVESELHDHLKDHRSHGEWFYPDPEVVKVADLIAAGEAKALICELNLFKLLPSKEVEQMNFDQRMRGF